MSGWDLIERAKAGDMDAFGEFYRRYYDAVLRLLLSKMRFNRGSSLLLAEDLAQTTFERVLRSVDSIADRGEDPMALLRVIASNLYADYRKSSRVRNEVSWTVTHDDDGPVNAEFTANYYGQARFIGFDGRAPSAEESYLKIERAREVRDAAARLHWRHRECLWLRFYEGRSLVETADELGSNENAVKALQHRATRRLAKLMEAA